MIDERKAYHIYPLFIDIQDQKRVKIQELLHQEVLSYRKPKPINFDALITSKTADSGKTDDDPYADLNDFLAQLASPVKELSGVAPDSSKSTKNPLLAGGKPVMSQNATLAESHNGNPLLAGVKPIQHNSLLASQAKLEIKNPLLAGSKPNPLLNSQSTTNPLLAQAKALPFQNSNNKLLFSAAQTNPLLEGGQSGLPPTQGIKSEKAEQVDNDVITVTVPTTSDSDQSNDTELFNNFLRNRVRTESDADHLTVNTGSKPNSDDIEMISAKLKQTDISDVKPEVLEKKEMEEGESKALDTKSILRQRLIDKQNATAGM